MKMFVNVKAVCATILCFIMAITLCACKTPAPSSSETNGTSQTSSLTSSTDEQLESSSESVVTSTSSTDEQLESSSESVVTSTSSTDTKKESSSKSSEPSSVSTDKTPTSSESTTTTPTTTTPPKTPDQIIVGKWHGSVDMAPIFTELGYPMEDSQMVSCDVEFTPSGVIYETIDRESLNTVYTNVFTKMLNDLLTENNLTKEQFEASFGKTYDEYLNELVQATMELIPQTAISTYKFEGNDLYVREQNDADFEKEEYSFNGENKLTIVESGVSITYTRIG